MVDIATSTRASHLSGTILIAKESCDPFSGWLGSSWERRRGIRRPCYKDEQDEHEEEEIIELIREDNHHIISSNLHHIHHNHHLDTTTDTANNLNSKSIMRLLRPRSNRFLVDWDMILKQEETTLRQQANDCPYQKEFEYEQEEDDDDDDNDVNVCHVHGDTKDGEKNVSTPTSSFIMQLALHRESQRSLATTKDACSAASSYTSASSSSSSSSSLDGSGTSRKSQKKEVDVTESKTACALTEALTECQAQLRAKTDECEFLQETIRDLSKIMSRMDQEMKDQELQIQDLELKMSAVATFGDRNDTSNLLSWEERIVSRGSLREPSLSSSSSPEKANKSGSSKSRARAPRKHKRRGSSHSAMSASDDDYDDDDDYDSESSSNSNSNSSSSSSKKKKKSTTSSSSKRRPKRESGKQQDSNVLTHSSRYEENNNNNNMHDASSVSRLQKEPSGSHKAKENVQKENSELFLRSNTGKVNDSHPVQAADESEDPFHAVLDQSIMEDRTQPTPLVVVPPGQSEFYKMIQERDSARDKAARLYKELKRVKTENHQLGRKLSRRNRQQQQQQQQAMQDDHDNSSVHSSDHEYYYDDTLAAEPRRKLKKMTTTTTSSRCGSEKKKRSSTGSSRSRNADSTAYHDDYERDMPETASETSSSSTTHHSTLSLTRVQSLRSTPKGAIAWLQKGTKVQGVSVESLDDDDHDDGQSEIGAGADHADRAAGYNPHLVAL